MKLRLLLILMLSASFVSFNAQYRDYSKDWANLKSTLNKKDTVGLKKITNPKMKKEIFDRMLDKLFSRPFRIEIKNVQYSELKPFSKTKTYLKKYKYVYVDEKTGVTINQYLELTLKETPKGLIINSCFFVDPNNLETDFEGMDIPGNVNGTIEVKD